MVIKSSDGFRAIVSGPGRRKTQRPYRAFNASLYSFSGTENAPFTVSVQWTLANGHGVRYYYGPFNSEGDVEYISGGLNNAYAFYGDQPTGGYLFNFTIRRELVSRELFP